MSDPAIEAAQRAWEARRGSWVRSHFDPNNRLEQVHIAAAREALKPIRDLHKPVDDYGDGIIHCSCCSPDRWPCATAKLIYTTEELSGTAT